MTDPNSILTIISRLRSARNDAEEFCSDKFTETPAIALLLDSMEQAETVLAAIEKAGGTTVAKALAIIEEYPRLKKRDTPQPTIRNSGVLLCPACHHRVEYKHTFCKRCGQALGGTAYDR